MLEKFKSYLWSEYPIPQEYSVWGSRPGVSEVANLDSLLQASVKEIMSDILVTAYIEATGMITYMPEGTVSVKSAKLSGIYPFQGNRLIKCTYDKGSNRAYLRFYPAVIAYERKLTVEDVDNLEGDQLRYLKAYCLYKMADKEVSILTVASMSVDNGNFSLEGLTSFSQKQYEYYTNMKDEILIYNTVN